MITFKNEVIEKFQYQKGAIKTSKKKVRVYSTREFQYQKGAIKTPRDSFSNNL